MLTSLEKSCNKLLKFLSKKTKNRLHGISDKEIMDGTSMNNDELNSCITKLTNLGYLSGGHDCTCLTDYGREFLEKGGVQIQKPKWKTLDFYMEEFIKYIIGALIGGLITWTGIWLSKEKKVDTQPKHQVGKQ